jgi:hypothetical protein
VRIFLTGRRNFHFCRVPDLTTGTRINVNRGPSLRGPRNSLSSSSLGIAVILTWWKPHKHSP